MSRSATVWAALLMLVGCSASAQPVSRGGIGPSAIVFDDDTRLELDRRGRVRETVRREVQVLAPDRQEAYGVLVLGYDTFRRIRRMEGEILDANGRRVRKLHKSDIEDHPATSSYSLYDDSRVRVGRLYHDEYPYTVVWEYEVEHEGLLNWPTWLPQRSEDPVFHAALTVDTEEGAALRYVPERLELEPTVREERGRRILRWEGAFPRRTYEPLGPPWRDQLPALHLVADRFTMAGHAGKLDSWAGLGQWYGQLAVGREELPPEAAAEVERLIEGVVDPRERARRIYGHLQQTVRYVSVQLGIGGWQPFPASYVHERRYGDCKALTNYLGAMLKAAGVPAYPALIGNERPDLDPDFPRNAFNHAILYVPLPDGDLWLEATSQTAPFGYLGKGSEDRWALVVEPGGGRLVRTLARTAEQNAQIRQVEVELAAAGHAAVQAEIHFVGHQLNRVQEALRQRSPQEREEWWRRRLGVLAADLHVRFDEVEPEDGPGAVVSSFTVPRYATTVGSRLLFRPSVLERWTAVPPAVESRLQPVELGYPFADVDTVRFSLPAGFVVEALPEPVRVETPFARYESEVVAADGALVYTRRVEIDARRLPPEVYEAYRSFVAAVVQADDAQVVLRRP